VQNRKAEFAVLDQEIAEIAKALSHPARLSILKILAKQKDCMCGDIVDLLPLAQSTVSQHLKYLKEVGLITGEIAGPKSCYCLNDEKIQKFKRDINEIFAEIDSLSQKNNCC
jgi:ArsR family transcriptional regulator